jgi:DNA-binding transcriptional LysR family regulator
MLRATFRQLQTFVFVAETGSFAAAAARLGVSPAAVSDQVRALERKFGCKLFDRRPGTVPVLNEKGSALLRKAPELLDAVNEMEGLSAEPPPQRVRVGAGDYVLEHLFLPGLSRFRSAHPTTQIEFVRLSSSQEAARATSANELDLAYSVSCTRSEASAAEFVGISRPVLFVGPNHESAGKWKIGSNTRLPMIMPPAGSPLERMIVHLLAAAGIIEFDVVTRAQHPDTIISLAMANVGAGCLMREHAHNALMSHMLIDLGVTLPPLYRFAFRRPNALEHPYLREVDEFALTILRKDLMRANPESFHSEGSHPPGAAARISAASTR